MGTRCPWVGRHLRSCDSEHGLSTKRRAESAYLGSMQAFPLYVQAMHSRTIRPFEVGVKVSSTALLSRSMTKIMGYPIRRFQPHSRVHDIASHPLLVQT